MLRRAHVKMFLRMLDISFSLIGEFVGCGEIDIFVKFKELSEKYPWQNDVYTKSKGITELVMITFYIIVYKKYIV